MEEYIEILRILKRIAISLMVALLIVIVMGNILNIYDKKEREKYLNSDEYKQLIEKQEKCNHNYVTTSSGMGRGLKIYSKCSKCGKEIK